MRGVRVYHGYPLHNGVAERLSVSHAVTHQEHIDPQKGELPDAIILLKEGHFRESGKVYKIYWSFVILTLSRPARHGSNTGITRL